MMTKNKKDALANLLEELTNFTKELCLLFDLVLEKQEGRDPIPKGKTRHDYVIWKNEKIKISKFQESIFISMFSEFEKFLAKLIDSGLQLSNVKKIFHSSFNKLCKQEMMKEFSNMRYERLHNKNAAQAKNKNLLIEKKKILDLVFILFSLDKKDEKIREAYLLYSEGRERRNNLIHSGIVPTPNYLDAMKTLFSRNKKAESLIKKSIYSLLSRVPDKTKKGKPKEQEIKQLKDIEDLSITNNYFLLTFTNLIKIASYIVLTSTREINENRYFYIHEIVALSQRHQNIGHINFSKILEYGIKTTGQNPVSLVDIFNMTLLRNTYLKLQKKDILKKLKLAKKHAQKESELKRIATKKNLKLITRMIQQAVRILPKLQDKLKLLNKDIDYQVNHINNKDFLSSKISEKNIKDRGFLKKDIQGLLTAHLKDDTKSISKIANLMIRKSNQELALFEWAIFETFKNRDHFKKNISERFWM